MVQAVVGWNMSQKNPEHIIDYILHRTERKPINEYWKKHAKQKKNTFEKNIYYCVNCKDVWSRLPDWVDHRSWRAYPKGAIPTYGKIKKICPNCRSKNGRT